MPNLSARAAALAVTAQGDGCWMIDAEGEPIGGGLLWLDSRAADLVADYMKSDADARHYAQTGSGLNACMASGQLAWMKRWQPERLARATTCFHCKDWLYFKLTGARVTDPSEGNFTFGDFRTRQYEPAILEGMGIADCRRLLPPMIEGTAEGENCRQPRPISPACRRPAGHARLCRRRVHGARGGLYDPSGRSVSRSSARQACTCDMPPRRRRLT